MENSEHPEHNFFAQINIRIYFPDHQLNLSRIFFKLDWTQTFFKGIALFKSTSEKDACFSYERFSKLLFFLTIAFFDHSDMSH
ncbi:hypothetical protein BpHYR1_027191 [Brachionus plicatilis]|uniref:Uncharacterized protein n=1 Tax=Brachionus plicatilis TaxID=10195 RepID=A0A3M7Q5E4_BRAPC|nr:hypothetical protein BpHYR1_027191 [Brachionus plicatilis]